MDFYETDARESVSMLAVDRRESVRRLLNPRKPASVTSSALQEAKLDIVRSISPFAGAVLIDPQSAAMCMKARALSAQSRLLICLERSGYDEHHGERLTRLALEPRSVMKMGADGAKLQIHYNPRYLSSMHKQTALAREVKRKCDAVSLPLLLEIIPYEVPQAVHERAMLEAASALSPHCDLLMCEFPSLSAHQDEATAFCSRFSEAAGVPWLLSSGAEPEFLRFSYELEAACRGGARGFASGLAVWSEAAGLPRRQRRHALDVICAGRFRRLSEIAKKFGRRP